MAGYGAIIAGAPGKRLSRFSGGGGAERPDLSDGERPPVRPYIQSVSGSSVKLRTTSE